MTANSEGGAPRILVVDDEIGMREGCRRALIPRGFEVETADSLSSAGSRLSKQSYDLFLLDIMLPDGSGLTLVESIRERDPDAVCIVITGFGSIEMAVEAIRRGAYDFLSKPFTSDELIVAVEQGLERRRLKEVEANAERLEWEKEQLEQLDQIKSQFMLTVAHELRAPVAAAQSYLNLVDGGYIAEEEMRPTLSRVQERLQETLDLISDLLELARLKQAKDRLAAKASPQPMAEILREVCDIFADQAREKEQSLQVRIRSEPIIAANRDHLKTIWTNLISNAIKYTPRGGVIVAELESSEGRLTGSVTDTGIGIGESDRQHLFEDFYRTEQAKASGQIGTGLGLAIVKQIVESYRGDITVVSQLGTGSQFTFVLPLEPPGGDSADMAVPSQVDPT